MSHQRPLVLSLVIIIVSFPITAKANSLEESTSPNVLNAILYSSQQSEIDTNVITFSEFSAGSTITNQYANRGIIFGPDINAPFITTDLSNPTSPVLSGTPRFTGPIEGRFVNPNDTVTPITVAAFSFDAGYFNTNGSTLIEWFDPNNNKLGEQTNSVTGIQHFYIGGSNIARWRIAITGSEPDGYALDNLKIDFGPCEFNKVSDINDGDCVLPGREINYTITYDFNGTSDTNVSLIDYLPVEVDYNSSSPEGDYDSVAHTVTWNIGTVNADSNGIFSLKVNVNNLAEPCGMFTNTCKIEGDVTRKIAEVNTPVCAWNSGIIYVDDSATSGRNTGMSWENAYLDLQKALDRANHGFGSEIWVAKGIYKPSIVDPCLPYGYWTFKLINGIPLYGHFAGNETSIYQRDFNDTNNETIISGATSPPASYVITAYGLNQNNILDGFTITRANSSAGITIQNAYIKVSNCLITGPGGNGIFATNSGFTVDKCNIQNGSYGISASFNNNGALPETQVTNSIIRNNSQYGIYLYQASSPVVVQNSMICNNYVGIEVDGSSSLLLPVITKCKIFANSYYGIEAWGGSAAIIDNWIYHNTQGGIRILYNSIPTIIRNNTIVNNNGYGVYRYNDNWATPVMTSSIIWGNPSGDLYGCSGSYLWLTANGDPCFVNADVNDFHLRPASLCIDAGDPTFTDFNDTDIDGERRIMDGDHDCIWRVDIGADEFSWPMADFNKDEIVNFTDFAIFANSWKTIDPAKSFDSDNNVDTADLAQFCEEWLWYRPKPDFDRNHSVDFHDFALLAASWKTLDERISLDENCDVDIYDLAIFCDHWLSEE